MSLNLKLPGTPKDPRTSTQELGPRARVVGEVVAHKVINTARGSLIPQAEISIAEPDDVLELGWEDGIVELIRVSDLEQRYPQQVRDVDSALTLPTQRSIQDRTRGKRDINLEFVKQFHVKISARVVGKSAELTVLANIKQLESQHMPSPGLYHLNHRGELTTPVESPLPVSETPYLVLIHGTFSSTAGSYAALFQSDDWAKLFNAYEKNQVLALDHHTVTESPALNAYQLVSKLPEGAKLHLLTYSRGGLVGDLICRYPWNASDETNEISTFFADSAYENTRGELADLKQELDRKQITVERFCRVASPAAGTLLASKRADIYLNVILSIVGKLLGPGEPLFDFVKAIALAIISTRTKADALPGLEAMMPHTKKGYVPFLNCAEERGIDLAVIAGDVRGGGPFDQIKDFFSNLYYWEDNDFVVDSKSMFRGVPRQAAWGYYYRSPRADHFSYFSETPTRTRMVEWLTERREDRFQLISAAQPYGGLRGAPTRAIPSLKEVEQQRRDLPVLFLLPGIMGTHLAQQDQRQWIHLWRLAQGGLKTNLSSNSPGIQPDGLIEMVYEQIYTYLWEFYDVIPFGFDWRKSIQNSAQKLATQVQVELDAHDKPIRILAHSMGGLVARALLAANPNLWEQMTRRGGRLVMLGTPNYGSYVPAQVFTQQHKLMKLMAAADLRNDLEDLTDVVREFPGLMEMLPFKDEVDWFNPDNWQGFETFQPSTPLLTTAKRYEAGGGHHQV